MGEASRQPGPPSRPQQLPILALDSRGVVIRANAQARRFFAESGAPPEGREVGALLALVLGDRRAGVARATLSFQNHRAEKESITLVLSEGVRPAPNEKAAEAAPRESDSGPSSLADFIAHELRNPLSTIIGISQILQDRFQSMAPADLANSLESIHAEADRAVLVLKSLLQLAEARNRPLEDGGSVPLHAVLRRVIATRGLGLPRG